jgi:hypothetical protein
MNCPPIGVLANITLYVTCQSGWACARNWRADHAAPSERGWPMGPELYPSKQGSRRFAALDPVRLHPPPECHPRPGPRAAWQAPDTGKLD